MGLAPVSGKPRSNQDGASKWASEVGGDGSLLMGPSSTSSCEALGSLPEALRSPLEAPRATTVQRWSLSSGLFGFLDPQRPHSVTS